MEKVGFVYMMSNKNRTTLYIGVTSDLEVRVLQHKAGLSNFTNRYNLFDLVYVEQVPGMGKAIAREKQLKNWHSDWKWNLALQQNPQLADLASGWYTPQDIEKCRIDGKEGCP
jgi:putative endonuclease